MAASCSCFSGSSRRVLGVSSLRPSPDRPQGAGEPPTVWGPVSQLGARGSVLPDRPQHVLEALSPDLDHLPALATVGLTDSAEEVAVLGEGHEGLGQLPQPLLEHPGDGVDGKVLQFDCRGVCGEGAAAGELGEGRRAEPGAPRGALLPLTPTCPQHPPVCSACRSSLVRLAAPDLR